MTALDLKNHFSLTSSDQVNEICRSPLESIGVTYFNYIKIFPDSSRELLTNNANWIEHFYKNGLYKNVGAIDIEYLLPKGYFLWSEIDTNEDLYSQGREFFNIDNGISFVIKRKNVTLLYIFASTRQNHAITNFYIRNIDLFKRFILYFNDKGSSLLNKASKNRIFLPEKQNIINHHANNHNFSSKNREKFYAKTDVDRFFLLNESDNLYITKKQAECMAYLVAGATAKQCAAKMGLSFRTVESYLDNVKNKVLDATGKRLSRNELTSFLKEAGIHDAIFPNKIDIFNETSD